MRQPIYQSVVLRGSTHFEEQRLRAGASSRIAAFSAKHSSMKKNIHDAAAAVFVEFTAGCGRLIGGRLSIKGCWLCTRWVSRIPLHTWRFFRVCLAENLFLRRLLAQEKSQPLPSDDVSSDERRLSKVRHVNWYRGSFFKDTNNRPRNRVAAYAFTAVLMLSLFGLYSLIAGSSEQPSSTIVTAIDQSRTFKLPDGSIARLGRLSQIKIEYVGEKRVVRLLWGRAMFDVEPDKQRPFIVKARGIDTTAVGTRFTVAIETAAVMVDVHEGVVLVGPEGANNEGMTIKLTKGMNQSFPVEPAGAIAR